MIFSASGLAIALVFSITDHYSKDLLPLLLRQAVCLPEVRDEKR